MVHSLWALNNILLCDNYHVCIMSNMISSFEPCGGRLCFLTSDCNPVIGGRNMPQVVTIGYWSCQIQKWRHSLSIRNVKLPGTNQRNQVIVDHASLKVSLLKTSNVSRTYEITLKNRHMTFQHLTITSVTVQMALLCLLQLRALKFSPITKWN
jgi:hypothetical protein